MIVNTIISLVIVGLLGAIRLRMRYDRLLSWIMFFLITAIFCNYVRLSLNNIYENFSFLWNSTKIGDIIISFSPYQSTNYMIIPLFFLSLYSVFNNNIFRYEERRSIFNSLIIINFVALCLLICAQNYAQLITAVFVSDILGYMVLRDVDSSRRYVVYNFFADMCLFMIFALISGRLQSLDMHQLLNYNEIGRHKDFVSTVTAIAIFTKMGCALFQSYLLDVSSVRFQRMSAVNLLFSPLCGIILLAKLYNILVMSEVFLYMYQIFMWLSFSIGCIFFVLKDNIQNKMVYLNMALIGFLMYILQKQDYVWNLQISLIYICVYFINFLFFKIYLYQNRENCVSKMVNIQEVNSFKLKNILIQLILLSNIFLTLGYSLSLKYDTNVINILCCIILLVLAVVLNHIYKSPNNHKLDYLEFNPLRVISFISNFLIFAGLIYYTRAYKCINLIFTVIFTAIIANPYIAKSRSVYNKNWVQNEDASKLIFYYAIQKPFTYLSKQLWIIFDFIISERIITAAITSINRISISIFFKINPKTKTAFVIFIVIGFIIFLISFYEAYRI